MKAAASERSTLPSQSSSRRAVSTPGGAVRKRSSTHPAGDAARGHRHESCQPGASLLPGGPLRRMLTACCLLAGGLLLTVRVERQVRNRKRQPAPHVLAPHDRLVRGAQPRHAGPGCHDAAVKQMWSAARSNIRLLVLCNTAIAAATWRLPRSLTCTLRRPPPAIACRHSLPEALRSQMAQKPQATFRGMCTSMMNMFLGSAPEPEPEKPVTTWAASPSTRPPVALEPSVPAATEPSVAGSAGAAGEPAVAVPTGAEEPGAPPAGPSAVRFMKPSGSVPVRGISKRKSRRGRLPGDDAAASSGTTGVAADGFKTTVGDDQLAQMYGNKTGGSRDAAGRPPPPHSAAAASPLLDA